MAAFSRPLQFEVQITLNESIKHEAEFIQNTINKLAQKTSPATFKHIPSTSQNSFRKYIQTAGVEAFLHPSCLHNTTWDHFPFDLQHFGSFSDRFRAVLEAFRNTFGGNIKAGPFPLQLNGMLLDFM